MVNNTVNLTKLRSLLRNDEILVGFIGGQQHANSDETTADIAKKNSYGFVTKNAGGEYRTVPARPFLEEGMTEGMQDIQKAVKDHYERLTASAGKDKQGLHKIGIKAVDAVKKFVWSDFYKGEVPNAPWTIEQKSKGKAIASDHPLIDTGEMVNSTTYVVRENVPV